MNIKSLARSIDQPLFLNKLQKKMPFFLISAAAGYGIYDTCKFSGNKDKKTRKNYALKNFIIISTTAASSLIGANGLKIRGKKIFPSLIEKSDYSHIVKTQSAAIEKYFSSTNISDLKLKKILQKAKCFPLSPNEVDIVLKKLPQNREKSELLNIILPEPENLKAGDIFSEIGRLSLLGAIPVVGGILGGITADAATKSMSKNSTANKIKEGFYQYFANIFLCNVGACAALFTAEGLQKAGIIKPLSAVKKMAVILTGITATGIIGGSWIANKLSQKLIDPLFGKSRKNSHRKVYEERKPELADIALHADDIATAGVLSGFKWIEPALPLMYFVSGYRAGIGYRNNCKDTKYKKPIHNEEHQ